MLPDNFRVCCCQSHITSSALNSGRSRQHARLQQGCTFKSEQWRKLYSAIYLQERQSHTNSFPCKINPTPLLFRIRTLAAYCELLALPKKKTPLPQKRENQKFSRMMNAEEHRYFVIYAITHLNNRPESFCHLQLY